MDVKTQTAGTLVKKMYKGPRGVLGDRESRDECSWMLAVAWLPIKVTCFTSKHDLSRSQKLQLTQLTGA